MQGLNLGECVCPTHQFCEPRAPNFSFHRLLHYSKTRATARANAIEAVQRREDGGGGLETSTRFPPPPVVLTTSNNSIRLAKPDDLPPKFCFTDASIARSLNIDVSKLPYDTYCPSAVGTLTERTCPVCLINFPSRAQMIVHRRAMHKYSRVKLGPFYEDKLLELSTDINVILSKSQEGYTCVLKNGYVDVQQLDDDHKAVVAFQKSLLHKSPMNTMSCQDWVDMVPSLPKNP